MSHTAPLSAHTVADPRAPAFREAWRAIEAQAHRVPAPEALVAVATPKAGLRIAAATENGQLVGVWPFRITRAGPLKLAVRPGGPVQVYDGPTIRADAREATITQALWAVVKGWSDVDLVMLPAFLPDTPLHTLVDIGRVLIPKARTARIRLATLDSAEALVARQPKHRRKSIRRRGRALAKRGDVAFSTPTDPAERADCVAWALDTKVAWLDDQDALGMTVRSPAFRKMLDDLARKPAGLIVHQLTVGDELAAVELGFCDGRSYHSYLGTFHPDFAKEGAGVALTLEVVGWAIAQGLSDYDLLAPLTDFKATWSDHQRVVSSAMVPMGVRGHLAAPLFRDTRDRLKQLGGKLPAGVREPVLTAFEWVRPK